MARHNRVVTIDTEDRDFGKTFVLTEMPAWDAIRFCARAMLALSQTGANIPAGMIAKAADGGPEAFAALGLQMFALVPTEVALPLLDEARACIAYQPPDSRVAVQKILDGAMCQVEEPTTWAVLLKQVWVMHLGFLKAAALPTME